MTDHQALEPLLKRNRSNKTYSAPLTSWLDRLPQFTINVNCIDGKHVSLTDYSSRNPIAPAQKDEAYEKEYVINSLAPHFVLVSKFDCLGNHFNQSHSENEPKNLTEANKYRSTDNTRERNAIISFDRTTNSDVKFTTTINSITIDPKTIDNFEKICSSQETTDLIGRWRNIVKPGVYQLPNGNWKKYHEPKVLRDEGRTMEERLSELIRRLESPAVEIRNRLNQNQQQAKCFSRLAIYRSTEL